MQESFLPNLHEASDNISQHLQSLFLTKPPLLLNQATQIALITILCNNIAVGGLAHDIVAF